jgi:cell division protein FtsB
MKVLDKIIRKYLQKLNKYWVTVIVFAVITFFVGDSTIERRIFYRRQIKSLYNKIEYHTKEAEKKRKELNAIKSGRESLEKYAREQYLMTKPDEELFIISE